MIRDSGTVARLTRRETRVYTRADGLAPARLSAASPMQHTVLHRQQPPLQQTSSCRPQATATASPAAHMPA